MKIRPLQDRIIVRRVDEEETTKGGIIIPDTAKEKPQEGKVIAVITSYSIHYTKLYELTQNDIAYYPGAFVIRGEQAPALAPQVQRIINEMAPEQPILRVATLEQIRREKIAAERLNTFLSYNFV